MEYVVIANGAPPPIEIVKKKLEGRLLVAVDGGLNYCKQNQITPDLITGDFDSATPDALAYFSDVETIETPDQNFTDLAKALLILVKERAASQVFVFGATGKRVDHSLANLFLLREYPDTVRFETEEGSTFAISGNYQTELPVGTTLSLFSLEGRVPKITTQGLKWNVEETAISPEFYSISNLTISPKISVTIPEGYLLMTIANLD